MGEPTPNPGIYHNVPAATYHTWPAASSHKLALLARSPAHLHEHEDNQTEAMVFGEALHAAVLTPDIFAATYTVADQCGATKKDGERCGNGGVYLRADGTWRCGVHAKGHAPNGTVRVLSADDAKRIDDMTTNIMGSDKACGILNTCTNRELSLVWDDPATGVRCRARLDMWGGGIIGDVKTTMDARRAAFERQIFAFNYYTQAAFYMRGAAACGLEPEHFALIAVEKQPHHGVKVYRVMDDLLQLGHQQIDRLLATWKECQASGIWPSYEDGIEDIAVPAWARRQIENGITMEEYQ